MLSAQVEAVPFTRPQLNKIFLDIDCQVQNELTLDLNSKIFTEKFNALMIPILKEGMQLDDVSLIEPLFLIDNPKFIGNTFANMFGDYRALVVGLKAEDGNFKVLNFCYTTPEERSESLFTIWLLTAFIKSISPETDAEILMNELTTENSSGNLVKGNVKFSITTNNNLNTLTATATE